MLADALFEGNGGCEAFAEKRLPGRDVGDSGNRKRIEDGANSERKANGLHVAGLAEIRIGFFGVFWDGFETGHEVGNDLQRKQDGEERRGLKDGMKICRSATEGTDAHEREKNQQDHRGHGFLEIRAETNAAIIDGTEKQSERDAQNEPREKNGLAGDAVNLEGIERRKNVGGNFPESDGFPRANDEVGEKHHPAGEIADDGRKNLGGVGGFAGSVGEALDPLAVNIANGEQNHAADCETERSSGGTATAKPVVHENEPAGANHGAESESEIIVEAKFASESGHLENAEKFVEKIGGEERSNFAGVVRRRDFDQVAANEVEATKGANEFEDLDAGKTAYLRSARAGSKSGIDTVDIESDVNGFTAEGSEVALDGRQAFFVKLFGGDHFHSVGAGKIEIILAVDLTAQTDL